jgi:outer membrane protein OmpA-like peptidoglycan-associated protein
MLGRSFSFPLSLGLCLALFVHLPASRFGRQDNSNAVPYAANQDATGCPRLKVFPDLPMAVVESCQSADSAGITVPLRPDANGFAQQKQVRGKYEFREYRISQPDQEYAFNNLMTLVPIAGFIVEYSIKPSTITARNGDTWMLINIASESYNVSVVRTAPQPGTPAKTAEEISQEMKVHDRVAIYGIEFSRVDQAIQEKHSQILLEILKYFNQNPGLSMVIESHKVSATGKPEDDLEITRERANAVMDWLVAHGIARSRLQSRPFGRRNPLTENETATEIQQNERIVLAKALN